MTNRPITIVLPMYNAESLIQRTVREVLELAQSFTGDFSVVIVDNGSTDETYESACELASVYPQVTVLRQAVQQGLRRVLDVVRRNCRCDTVVVHDGVTPIDVEQLRSMLVETKAEGLQPPTASAQALPDSSVRGSRRFGALRQLQTSMESAHASISGFRWVRLENPLLPRRCGDAVSTTVVTAMPSLPLTETTLPLT